MRINRDKIRSLLAEWGFVLLVGTAALLVVWLKPGHKPAHTEKYWVFVNAKYVEPNNISEEEEETRFRDFLRGKEATEYIKAKADIEFAAKGLLGGGDGWVTLTKLYSHDGEVLDMQDCDLNEQQNFPNQEVLCTIEYDDDTTQHFWIRPTEPIRE